MAPDRSPDFPVLTGPRWSASIATESQMTAAPNHAAVPDRASTAVVAWAYILAVILPVVGCVVGLVLMFKQRLGHGIAVLAISFTVLAVATVLVLDELASEPTASEQLEQLYRDIGATPAEDSAPTDPGPCTVKDPATGDCLSYTPIDKTERPFGEPRLDKAKFRECVAAADTEYMADYVCGRSAKP